MFKPGANKLMHGPEFEKRGILSSKPEAPTIKALDRAIELQGNDTHCMAIKHRDTVTSNGNAEGLIDKSRQVRTQAT